MGEKLYRREFCESGIRYLAGIKCLTGLSVLFSGLLSTACSRGGSGTNPFESRLNPLTSGIEALVTDPTAINNILTDFEDDTSDYWENFNFGTIMEPDPSIAMDPGQRSIRKVIAAYHIKKNGTLPNTQSKVAILTPSELETARDYFQSQLWTEAQLNDYEASNGTIPPAQILNVIDATPAYPIGGPKILKYEINELSLGRVPFMTSGGTPVSLNAIIQDINPDFSPDTWNMYIADQIDAYQLVLRILESQARDETFDHTSGLEITDSALDIPFTNRDAWTLLPAESKAYAAEEARRILYAQRLVAQTPKLHDWNTAWKPPSTRAPSHFTYHVYADDLRELGENIASHLRQSLGNLDAAYAEVISKTPSQLIIDLNSGTIEGNVNPIRPFGPQGATPNPFIYNIGRNALQTNYNQKLTP
ncbi:MAG: hypothetical protein ACE5FT_05505 [Candidatus Nanoarchaeia archaeon]